MTASGRTAASVAKQFGFRFCGSELSDLLGADTDAVVIATRHNSHADYVCRALAAGKHVFVEKPLALTMDELAAVAHALAAAPQKQLQVGFNRRYAPLTREVLDHFEQVKSPRVVAIRVNAGFIPPDHWSQDPEVGGGRIIGEACHFIDLACALAASEPVEVHASGVQKGGVAPLLNDNVVISLRFADGGVASVVYTSDGSKAQAKERVEVFGGGRAAVIDDFRAAEFYKGDSSSRHLKVGAQDKGQVAMLSGWIDGLRAGRPQTHPDTLLAVSAASIAAVESMTIGGPVKVDMSYLRLASA
jgi:polar amino acid transport system substrate-binding protein